MSKRPLVAAILAAGGGSRFFPFTRKIHFPFFGKPMHQFSVFDVLPSEVDRVVIITNPEHQTSFEGATPKPMTVVIQRQPLGMADALLSAAEELKDAELLVVIADDIVDPRAIGNVLTLARKTDAFCVLPGREAPGYFPGGYLKTAGDRILGVIEKPDPDKLPGRLVTISGHFFRDSTVLLDELRVSKSDSDDVYERALTTLALRKKIIVSPYNGPFSSLKYPWQPLEVMESMFEMRLALLPSQTPSKRAGVTIEGTVVFGKNVRIFENTKIVGPCYIGDNVIIGNNCIVRESHIGANGVIGFNTDITRSYIGDNCWFHSNYIGDSVLEGDISIGAGAALANLRLDDGEIFSVVKGVRVSTMRNKLGAMIARGVRIGVNASIMPGVKIGQHSFIASGVVLDRDITENCFVSLSRNSYTVAANTNSGQPASREEFKRRISVDS